MTFLDGDDDEYTMFWYTRDHEPQRFELDQVPTVELFDDDESGWDIALVTSGGLDEDDCPTEAACFPVNLALERIDANTFMLWGEDDEDFPINDVQIRLDRLAGGTCSIEPLSEPAADALPFEAWAHSGQRSAPPWSLFFPSVELALDIAIENLRIAHPSVGRVSGHRPLSYQAHFYEIRTKDAELRQAVVGNPGQAAACADLREQLDTEISVHRLQRAENGLLAVSRPALSSHTRVPANAVDLFGASTAVIPTMAVLGLELPCPRDPAFHVTLRGTGCQSVVVGTSESPVAIMITDPSGRRVGWDPVTATEVNEVGANASYSGVSSEPQIIEIVNPLAGSYVMSGVGTGEGPYALTLQRMTEDGHALQSRRATGEAQLGAHYELVQDIPTRVQLDVLPQSASNIIDGSRFTPVAMLSTDSFDARTIDPLSLTFGATGSEPSLKGGCLVQDVNQDFRKDLVCSFRLEATGLDASSVQAVLRGKTRSGTTLEGTDLVQVKR